MAKPPLLSLPNNILPLKISDFFTIFATPQHWYRQFVVKELNFCQRRQKN